MIGAPVARIQRVVTLVDRHASVPALFFALGCTSPQAEGGGNGSGEGGALPSGGAAGSQFGGGGVGGSAGSGTGGVGAVAGSGAGAGAVAGAGVGGSLAGSSGAGGAGSGGTAGSGGSSGQPCSLTWPTAIGTTVDLSETMMVSGVLDGGMKRYRGVGALGTSGQNEDQAPLIELADGATLENAVIGAPAADGIHCEGTCTLYNVWWEDVGEDAATFEGDSSTQTMTLECVGARNAEDKVFQHNGPGTMILRHVLAEDFSKLYRSCGNCLEQFERHVVLDDITARNGSTIVGINENYGDTADFSNIVIYPAPRGTTVCVLYQGNDTGAEPRIVGDGPDPMHCRYEDSDIDER